MAPFATTISAETASVNQALLLLSAAAEAAAHQQRRCTHRLHSSPDSPGSAAISRALLECTDAARAAGRGATDTESSRRTRGPVASHDDLLVLRRLSHATRKLMSPGGKPARVRPQSAI
jgi:hypothetical protein